MDERVIIFTSNHPNTLDPAFLRPGRIDYSIEFTKLSCKNINKIYEKWFNQDIPIEIYNKIPDYKFSLAEITNIFKKYGNDKELLFNNLN